MKEHSWNKDTDKDYDSISASVSQHSFGFIHGFVFCLFVKNICKQFSKESALNHDCSFDRLITSSSQSVCVSGHSSAEYAGVKEETPEAQTAEADRSAGQDCNPCNLINKTPLKFIPDLTEDADVSCDERDSPFPSFYLPLTSSDVENERDDDKESREVYDCLPKDLPDVEDDLPSPVFEKSRLRKRKNINVENVKETEESDKGQNSRSKVTHKLSRLTQKAKCKVNSKLKKINTKKCQTSEKPNPDLVKESKVNCHKNVILDSAVKVDHVGVTGMIVPSGSQVFPCDKCDKTFSTARSCKRHAVRTHLKNGEATEKNKGPEKRFHVQCDKCSKVYTGGRAEKNLHQHMLAYHSELNPVQCDVCSVTLNNEHHLKLHKRSSHRKDVCYICGAHFVTQIGLQTHLLAHKGDKSYVCEVCGAAFVRVSSLRQHSKFHTDSRDFKCGKCPLSFKTFSSLSIHMMCVHQCGSYFSSQVQKLAKLGYVIDKGSMERLQNSLCVSCGKNLTNNVCSLHSSDCLLSFSCPQCQWTTKDIQKFRKHFVKRNSATVCSGTEEAKSIKNCGGLTSKNRPLVKNFACPSCGKQFYTQSHLQAHRHQHAEKRFSCPICDKSFTYKFNMQNHLTTHTDARPFECQVCQKTFKMKSQLQLHQRYHDGEFKCEVCGKILTRKQHVINHYKLVHPNIQLPNSLRTG